MPTKRSNILFFGLFLVLLICLVPVAVGCADKPAATDLDRSAAVANPMREYATLEQAEAATGINCPRPSVLPPGYAQTSVYTIANRLIQITYASGQGNIVYRVAEGERDISGIYGQFETKNLTIANHEVLARVRNDGRVIFATWTSSGAKTSLSQSVSFEPPADLAFLESFVAAISK